MRSMLRANLAAFALLLTAVAQEAPIAGHYEGVIQAPDQEVKFTVDLEKAGAGWTGYMSMVVGPRELPLEKIEVKGDTVAFVLKVPNPPSFAGKFDPATGTIKGEVTGAQGSVPFEMTRKGDAKKIVVTPSSALAAEFAGQWEGTLEAGGRSLRLQLTLKQGPDGKAQGTLVSLDQQNAEFPITTINQEGTKLSFEIRMINGEYKGAINEGKTELTGEWTQGGRTMPLVFKKAGAAEKK